MTNKTTTQDINKIRTRIDEIDKSIQELLSERSHLGVEIGKIKKQGNAAFIAPGRETQLIRRILERHHSPMPKDAVVSIWREIIGAMTLIQAGEASIAVTIPDDQQNAFIYADLARGYFSNVMPIRRSANTLMTMAMIREGEASFGVLPWPEDHTIDRAPWWQVLMDEIPLAQNNNSAQNIHIIGRLPLGDFSLKSKTSSLPQAADPEHRALVIGRIPFLKSSEKGDMDRSFIAFELTNDVSRARLVDKANSTGLKARSIYTAKSNPGTSLFYYLLEVEGYVEPNDKRLSQILTILEERDGRYRVLGGYPVPPQ